MNLVLELMEGLQADCSEIEDNDEVNEREFINNSQECFHMKVVAVLELLLIGAFPIVF